MATNDFKLWLDSIDIDLDDHFEFVYAVYMAIKTGKADASQVEFDAEGNAVVVFPKENGDRLTVSYEKRKAFLDYLDSLYVLKVEGEYALRNGAVATKVPA